MKRLIILSLWAGTLFLFCFTLAACNAPSDRFVQETAAQGTAFSEVYATLKASAPTQTPSPSITMPPSPTITPSSTPYLWTMTPAATETLPADYFHGSLVYEDVPLISQRGLRYAGYQTGVGCSFAASAMALAFWHDYKDEYPELSAQELLDLNVSQGSFDPVTGIAITQLQDDFESMGYRLGTRRNSNKEELLAALERYGPVITLVKVTWKETGQNHSALLVAYDEKTDEVTLNDPWESKPITMTYDAFDWIWGLNYAGKGTAELRRVFFFIVPKAEIRPSGVDLFIP